MWAYSSAFWGSGIKFNYEKHSLSSCSEIKLIYLWMSAQTLYQTELCILEIMKTINLGFAGL